MFFLIILENSCVASLAGRIEFNPNPWTFFWPWIYNGFTFTEQEHLYFLIACDNCAFQLLAAAEALTDLEKERDFYFGVLRKVIFVC